MSVLVPSSPSKESSLSSQIQSRYADRAHSSLYGSASSTFTPDIRASGSVLLQPARSSQSSTFLTSSANANRSASALSRKKETVQKRKTIYRRDDKSNIESKFRTLPETCDNRDESLRLVEELTIGPKKVRPDDGDVHFLKLEPTSGIALRQRKIPHKHFESHLEGRYYVPISTLYSIAEPGASDDGDFTIPVYGDWLTMGVVIKCSDIRETKGYDEDPLQQLANETTKFFAKKRVETKDDEVSKPKDKPQTLNKKSGPKKFIVLTLLDLAGQPDKFGQHHGSCEIELTLFESDSTWVEPGGKRKYSGGSGGAYEKLVTMPNGTLICILNPRLKKARSNPRQGKEEQDKNQAPSQSSMPFRLNARSGDSIALVGVAKNYGECQVDMCRTFVDKRIKTDVCQMHLDRRLSRTQNGRPQLMNSWRAPVNNYALSEGMAMGSKARRFVVDSRSDKDPSQQGGQLYDISAHYGRNKERLVVEAGEVEELEALQKRLGRVARRHTKISEEMSEESLKQKVVQKARLKREAQSQEGKLVSKGIFSDVMYDSAGTRVIEASRKTMQGCKSQNDGQSIKIEGTTVRGTKRGAVQDSIVDETIPAGSYRASNGDIKKMSDISNRLLSRHSVKASTIPRPILNRKRKKLAPSVKPPPGESFYAKEKSDDELDEILASDAFNSYLQKVDPPPVSNFTNTEIVSPASDSDSDLEIIPSQQT